MGGGASSAKAGGGGPSRGSAAYVKTDAFKDLSEDLQREKKELRRELEDIQREMRNQLEDLKHSQEELEDVTAASFAKVKEQLTRSERETKGLRSEVSHTTACVGKMGGAVRKHRNAAGTSEQRIEGVEQRIVPL